MNPLHVTRLAEKLSGCRSSSGSTVNQKEPSESSNKHDIPNAPQTMVQEESGPAEDHLYIQYNIDFDQTVEVDRINLIVKCAGKTTKVDMFPMEKISVLLKEACERTGKKPEKMRLVYKGECLDVNKTVSHYGLRGGATVNLIPY